MTFIFFIIFLLLFAVRLLRWLAIVQQKEYRWDRVKAFVRTAEGTQELKKLLPSAKELTRVGLKRPKITTRVIAVAGLAALIALFLVIVLAISLPPVGVLLGLVFIYLLLPLWVCLAVLPSVLFSRLLTHVTLKDAQKKVLASNARIIGITGSYGKTSTKHLLTHVLKTKYTVFTTPRSHNTKYSIAKAIVENYRGEEIIVLEYGAYTKNEIKELTQWFKPQVAVITGLAPQHIELFGSLENIIQAKSELIKALPENGTVVWYKDDSKVKAIVEAGVVGKDIMVIATTATNLGITAVSTDPQSGTLILQRNAKRVETQLVGQQYLAAVTLSVTVAKLYELSHNESLQAVATFKPTEVFVQSYTLKNGVQVIDDGGSANPEGVAAAVRLLDSLKYKEKILVFPGIVDLGELTHEIHQKLAVQAKDVATEVWYLGTEGVTEFSATKLPIVVERLEILHRLQNLKSDTVVLLEGKMPGWLIQEIESVRHDS